tara:strand:- start:938 stop:1252 length:315 start_codon:yes stop_codon:yes gene_type:complete
MVKVFRRLEQLPCSSSQHLEKIKATLPKITTHQKKTQVRFFQLERERESKGKIGIYMTIANARQKRNCPWIVNSRNLKGDEHTELEGLASLENLLVTTLALGTS